MSGRALIIVVGGIIIIASVILYNISASGTRIAENFYTYYSRQSVENIAQSAVNLGLRKLSDSSAWRAGYSNVSALGGKFTVRVFDTTFAGMTVVGVAGFGYADTFKSVSIAYVKVTNFNFKPKAALTTNGTTKTTGGIIIDGRDHTSAGALVNNQGVFGLWSTSTYNQGGGSAVGGTSMFGVDHAPVSPGDTSVIRTGQTYAGGYPTSPDSLLGGSAAGFPPGTLKALAQSHISGSQYVTDPSTLIYPLRGITYVELPSGGTWSPLLSGSGIIIVHNSSVNAVFKNPAGSFTGLIIADDINKMNGTVLLGAVIQLTATPSAQVIGNGNGSITYSSQAVQNALSVLTKPSGGSMAGVVTWWE